ncbi:hypothetical protein JQC67_13980 [Aurantibacter crassamenti]|uniref:hypothetical protein n=1 Tax=Aurantibacter crassamenti TaxID=1837375 RepID=UPI00193A6E6A|nr:hypothetical protein [Aurantibacter crassamenti]MBM1107259.1 hypothetical protein [Aurantibacter crassamenti]
MNKLILTFCAVLFLCNLSNAQRKSDLIAEVATLRTQLDSVSAVVAEAKNNEKIGLSEAESYKKQVTELQDANLTLMKNLNSFAEVSNKNTSIVNTAMATIEAKEAQLKKIKAALSSHDSTALVVLTNAKQTLGEDAKIGVANGAVIISSKLASIFGDDTGTTVTASSEEWLGKIAAILKANPKSSITIEGLSMTGDLKTPAQQAMAIEDILKDKFEIAPERLSSSGRDGNLKEGVIIKIHPNYLDFYDMVKEEMKN